MRGAAPADAGPGWAPPVRHRPDRDAARPRCDGGGEPLRAVPRGGVPRRDCRGHGRRMRGQRRVIAEGRHHAFVVTAY